ncbi:transcriptional regulator GcvA [Mesorhizobium sp. LHD-90]|uniref:transcriptional regulator GcvA n=1 Tax=Mesorhizobium sp. LHD-90 TaxID=3071414 RepID=UPI0027E05DD7|nr:transcriptional regulator GcvA [Mesorhizobium sp. LHD-90]MDQ6435111.1 transcriptional regulator GcvA [Mesorhizobium sp. LHD-90]
MALHIPGTRALKVFDAASRHLNFSRAAEELGLTPAAVSHQIKETEDQLGMALFIRSSRSIRLTEAGAVFHEAAAEALEGLASAVARAKKLARGIAQLKLTMDGTFASKWMVPRLDRFRGQCPGIDLRFDISSDLRDFDQDDVDVAIRFGTGRYPGVATHRLFDNVIFPVCSPRLLKSGPPLEKPRDLLQHTLVHIEWSRQGVTWPNWRMWMAAAGVEDFDDSRCLLFTDSSFVIQAAVEGNVVALCDFSMVANDLSEGRLVRPFDLGIKVRPEYAYHLAYPAAVADDPRIVAFRDWILEEARLTPSGA